MHIVHEIRLFVRIDYEVSELKGVQLLTSIKLLIKVIGYLTSKMFHIVRLPLEVDNKGC